MDPVSHVVLAHCVVGARGDERSIRGRGLAVTLGALAPDVDLLLAPAGWDRYLAAHEVGTHSLIGAVVCGGLAAGVALLARRRTEYRLLVLPAVVGAISHVAADLLTGASIRVWWPFVDARVANLGVVAMAEPWFVLATAIAGVALLTTRRRSHQSKARRMATGLLLAFAAFVVVASVLRERAEAAYRNTPAAREATGGYLVEPVWRSFGRWRIFDRTPRSVRAWNVDASGDVSRYLEIARASGEPSYIAASTAWPTVRHFQGAHEWTFAVATPHGVEWSDVRYCWPAEGVPQCGVWAGGQFSTPPQLHRLIVRVGDVVQVR